MGKNQSRGNTLSITHWKIGHRLGALGLIALVAILFLTLKYVGSIWEERDFRSLEQQGIEQIKPLYPVYSTLLDVRDSVNFYLYTKAILKTEKEALIIENERLEKLLEKPLQETEANISNNLYPPEIALKISEMIDQWLSLQGAWHTLNVSTIGIDIESDESDEEDTFSDNIFSDEEEGDLELDIEGDELELDIEINELDSEEANNGDSPSQTEVEKYNTSINQLIHQLQDVLVSIGEANNLVIDPELDSLYMINLVLNQIPAVTNAASISRGQSASGLVKKSMTFKERSDLGLYYGQLRLLNSQVNRSLEKAYINNSNIKPQLSVLQAAFNSQVNQFSDSIEALVKTETSDSPVFELLGSQTLFDEGSKAINAAFELNEAVISQVDIILTEAVTSKNREITITLITAVILLITLSIGGYVLIRSITQPVQQLMDTMVAIEKSGDFSLRIENTVAHSDSEIEQMSQSYNQLMDLLQSAISRANQVVTAVARGHFDQRMDGEWHGDLRTLKEGVNGSADSVEETMNALSGVMTGLSNGDLSVRMGDEVEELFRDQVNGAMASIDELLQEVGVIIKRLSQGDFTARMSYEVKGDLKELSGNINSAMKDLQSAISEVVNTANAMGEGDLTHPINGNYHGALGGLKDSINTTQTNISSIVSQVRTASQRVKNGANEIARGNHNLSSRTSEQAASLEETAASMEQMSSTVTMNSDSAKHASQLASDSLKQAARGSQVVADAISAMSTINQSSDKISDITTLIDGIAFQTNLLALNAAVEAARAGDHGRGFAVVAGEVRSLAQRSADAAKEISLLIDENVTSIKNGSELVSHSGEALENIQMTVTKLNNIAQEISSATTEQSQGINQVNTTVNQLDSVTQENSALVEHAASASNDLNEQADALNQIVSVFTLDSSHDK